jgi:hypothetical protein
MEVLRNHINVQPELLTNLDYDEDYLTASAINLFSGEEFTNLDVYAGTGNVTAVLLPDIFNQYDIDGYVFIYDSSDNIVFESGFSSVMPYCDIESVATELNISVAEATEYERLVRYIIDAKTGGFKFVYKQKEVLGMGSDRLLIDERINKLFKLFQNEELVYDVDSNTNEWNYFLNVSKTAILRETEENDENRIHYKKVWKDRYAGTEFPEDFDYIVEGEFGYFVIPSDIQEASKLLINDLACGNNRYLNKYMESIKLDGFDFKYFTEALFGTGNLIVDNILNKYGYTIRPRVM